MTTSSSLRKDKIVASPARRLGPEDAAVFETFVVPRYLSLFGEQLLAMLVPGRDARVCHLQCRTGYPDRALVERLPNVHVHGFDGSEHAIELARAKAATIKKDDGVVFDYRVAETLPPSCPPGAFSHAFTLHPLTGAAERKTLLDELARIVAPRGQALVGMPLRGSFIEIVDLLRECALKYELHALANAVEAAVQHRPTDEMLGLELERVGFEYVDVDVQVRTLKFVGGRGFFEDPVTRFLLVPELRVDLARDEQPAVDPLGYVRDAIDKYWSDRTFEMAVNVGVVSGRRRTS